MKRNYRAIRHGSLYYAYAGQYLIGGRACASKAENTHAVIRSTMGSRVTKVSYSKSLAAAEKLVERLERQGGYETIEVVEVVTVSLDDFRKPV